MKLISRRVALPCALFLSTSTTFASGDLPWNSLSDISQYLVNLGQYLGYDVTTSPSKSQNVSQTLLQVTSNAVQAIMVPTFMSLYGALPVNTAGYGKTTSDNASLPFFVPANLQGYSQLNASGNSTFESSGGVTISSLVDQPTTSGSSGGQYQNDPVSQAIANILMTPDYSFCLNNDNTSWAQCTYPSGMMNSSQIIQNVVGPIPDTQSFFNANFNQGVIPQLNSNSLLAPLMYSTTSTGNNTQTGTSVNTATAIFSNQTQQGPLQAQNPEQQAINFIRYATAAVSPANLPSRSAYDNLYGQIINQKLSQLQRFQAASVLANYLTTLRVYAAQTSVGISNLYYILSRRMPQPIVGSNNQSTTTSQALSEYTMATWRLFNPAQTQQGGTEWLNNLNQASAATMQKEIAVLLAEINYQLYLNRQQEERLLLTNSMLLLQNARQAQPTGALNNANESQNQTPSQ